LPDSFRLEAVGRELTAALGELPPRHLKEVDLRPVFGLIGLELMGPARSHNLFGFLFSVYPQDKARVYFSSLEDAFDLLQPQSAALQYFHSHD
jgi:hypothetical protein